MAVNPPEETPEDVEPRQEPLPGTLDIDPRTGQPYIDPRTGQPFTSEEPGTPPEIPENVNITTGTPVVLTDDRGVPIPPEETAEPKSSEPVIKQPDTPGGPYTQVNPGEEENPPTQSVFTQQP